MSKKNVKKLPIIITGLILFAMVGFVGNVLQAEATTFAITVTSPNGGESIVKGHQNYVIWWNVNLMPLDSDNKVNIYYHSTNPNQPNQLIIKGTENQNPSYGYYNWTVPETLEDGTYRIVVVAQGSGANLFDESDSDFNIVSSNVAPSITVTSPNGSEQYTKGSACNINWSTAGIVSKITIFSVDSNNTIRTIVSNITNNNSYNWIIPTSLNSGKYKIRVSGTDYSSATDISDDYFDIVEILSPPTNIKVVEVETPQGRALEISWNNPSDVSTKIYKSKIQGEIGECFFSIKGNTAMEDYSVKAGINYYYTVRSYNNSEESTNTKQYSGMINDEYISAPTNVSASFSGDATSVLFNWTTPNNSNFSHIRVYQSTAQRVLGDLLYDNLSKGQIGKTATFAFNVATKGLIMGRTYYYTVRSVDTAGNESINTNQHKITLIQADASAIQSTVVSSPNIIFADGESIANIIITVKSANGALLSNKLVKLSSNRNSDTVSHVTYFTGPDGRIIFSVKSSLAGVSTYTATVDKITINETAQVIFANIGTYLPDGTLIKIFSDPRIFVIINGQKKWIKTMDEFNQGKYKWENVQETDSEVINAYADYLEATANLLRSIGHHKVYRIINGKRLWIPTIAAFNAQGLKWNDIQNVPNVTQYPRLKLAKLTNKPEVYYLNENGFKRHIPTANVFNSYGNKWEDVVELSFSELNAYSDSALIRAKYKIYKLENGKKRWIKTAEAFNRMGYDWNKVSLVNKVEIDSYTSGAPIE